MGALKTADHEGLELRVIEDRDPSATAAGGGRMGQEGRGTGRIQRGLAWVRLEIVTIGHVYEGLLKIGIHTSARRDREALTDV